MLGLAFKENCPDLRNTRVVDIIEEFESYGAIVEVHDPCVDKREAQREYSISTIDEVHQGRYDAIVLAVPHDEFKKLSANTIHQYGKADHVLYDIKYLLDKDEVDGRL